MLWIALGCLELHPARIAGIVLHVCKLVSKTPWNLPGNKTPKRNWGESWPFIPTLIKKKDNLSCHGKFVPKGKIKTCPGEEGQPYSHRTPQV